MRPLSSLSVIALLLVGCAMETASSSQAPSGPAGAVSVHVFNGEGELIGPVPSPRVEKSESAWREQLTESQYHVTREAGTERAFSGELVDNKKAGAYLCVGCGLALYDAETKFESGTGWPSFYAPIADTNVAQRDDTSWGMRRIEVHCPRCGGHLGHVFDDGPPPTGMRHCINSAALRFVPEGELAALDETEGAPASAATMGRLETAVFAGGCFWCTEAVFERLDGVYGVVSGYAGGTAKDADYKKVSSGATDHAEVIEITYDSAEISYDRLLEIFFTVAHDPTQLDRQGPDWGRQYRSAVFYANDSERRAAEAMIKKLGETGKFAGPIVTTLEKLDAFYPAEQYHQDYVERNPRDRYVVRNALPKVKKLLDMHGDAVRR